MTQPFSSISRGRKIKDKAVYLLCLLAVLIGLLFLGVVIYGGIRDGLPRLSMDFITNPPNPRRANEAGVVVALLGSLWVVVLTMLLAVPVGVAAAIYLEEIAPKGRVRDIIQANIANLAGVPSIVYGLLGLAVFVRGMQIGTNILAAGLTMAVLVLPTIILVTQEALRMVPRSLREASLALGGTPWQTLFKQTLPNAFGTILTGIIFAAARAIGETAPLIVVGAVGFTMRSPDSLQSSYTVLPLQIYSWSTDARDAFKVNASAAIFVLIVVLTAMNLTAIVLRNKFQKR